MDLNRHAPMSTSPQGICILDRSCVGVPHKLMDRYVYRDRKRSYMDSSSRPLEESVDVRLLDCGKSFQEDFPVPRRKTGGMSEAPFRGCATPGGSESLTCAPSKPLQGPSVRTGSIQAGEADKKVSSPAWIAGFSLGGGIDEPREFPDKSKLVSERADASALGVHPLKMNSSSGLGVQLESTSEAYSINPDRIKRSRDDSVALAPTTPAGSRLRRLHMTEHDGQDERDDELFVEQASQCVVWSSASRRVCRVSPKIGPETPWAIRSATEQTPLETSRRIPSPDSIEENRRRKSMDSERTPTALELFSPGSRTLEAWRRLRLRRRSADLDKPLETIGTSPGTPFGEALNRLGHRASRAAAALLESVQGTGETQTENGIQIPAASSDSNPPGHEIEDEAMLSLFESYEERCAASDRLGSLVGGPREAASPRLFVVSATVENDPAGKKMQKLVAQPLTDNHPHRGATGRQHSESRPVPRLTVVLQDDWSTLNIQSGDIIRLIHCDSAGSYLPFESTFSEGSSMHAPSASFVVDAERNLCIHHPDVLVSGTSVANAFSCQRRVVLGERNRYSIHQPRTTRAALRGTLLHQLFQQLLLRQCCAADTSLQVTEADLRFAVRRYYAELYALGESEEDLVTYLQQATADLDTHVRSLCTDPNGVSLQVRGWSPFPNAHRMRIRHLFDVEESIWSPVFGLKGSIDVTAAVELDQRGGDSVHTMPITCLELKTGHREGFSGVAHRAQLILYALLLSERYRTSVLATVLLYMQCGQKADALALQGAAEQATESSLQMSFHLVPVPRPELVGIIMARNKLAQYLRFRGMMPEHDDDWLSQLGRSWMELPPPLQNQANMCSHCYVRDTCALLHRAIERGDADTSALPPAFAALTESLTETHLQYYRHWLALTRLEEEAAFANREEVWTLSPSRRALLGRCIGNLELVQVERTVALGGGRFAECFRHRFRTLPDSAGEHAASPSSLPKTACSSDTFEVPSVSAARWDLLPGDYVSISPYWTRPSKSLFPQGLDTTVPMDDWDPARQECAIAGGFVHQVKPLDHEIQVDLERDCGAWLERHPIPGCAAGAVRWRIDREELSAGFSTMYGNLEALLYPEAERIRRLVIDLEAPRFSHGKERSEISGSASLLSSERPTEIDADDLAWIQQQLAGTELNVEQQQAVERIMQAQDYTLLLGMPGTGKTATVACLIQLLVARGYSVLLASHTHSAVDNVLQRLIQNDFHAFIRLGTRSHIEPALWPYTLPAADSDQSDLQNSGHVRLPSLDAFTCRIEEASLVATTCLGASHPIFYRRRHFDYVIVDEASQIAQPVILGPLRFARRAFILVGDDKQLPPLARHPQAQAHGADESLFVRLCTAHPEAVTVLRRQYRMAADIMLLCNALVYQGAMECANDVTAQQTLPMSPKRPISDRVTPEWLQRVLDPSRRVLFLDTDAARGSALECRSGRESICNHFEARVVLRIVQALEAADIGTDRIGITSPLRAQVSLLQSHFHQSISTDWARAAPECRTIDQFQGRDKDILIVSLVRNNNDARIGQVLRDWRRLNVAMTRARCKLVFVGSIRTMRTSPFVERLIDLIRDKLHGLVPIEHLD